VSGELRKSATREAHLVNLRTMRNIGHFLDKTSSFAEKAAYMITAAPEQYENTLGFIRRSFSGNSACFGSALAIDPEGPLHKTYCRYQYRRGDSIAVKWLMPPAYVYYEKDWYVKAKEKGSPMWSEPYFDKGGGEVFMSTYSYPVYDLQERFLGVITADIELNTLSAEIQKISQNKGDFVFLVSGNGLLLSHPNPEFIFQKDINTYARELGSSELQKAAEDMRQGISGQYKIRLPDGDYTLYTMYVESTSWTVGIFMKNKVLFAPLKKLKNRLLLIMFAAILLIMLMVIIVSNQLRKNVAQQERTKHDIYIASRIQRQFLPGKEQLSGDRFSLSALMHPAKVVGGDFYGYKSSGPRLMFYVGDVSGKGIPASLFMMAAQMLIEDAMEEQYDPAYVLGKVNAKLSRISTTGMFATMIIGMIDFEQNELIYSVAGHPPFIIKSASGIYSPIPVFTPPIGVFQDLEYKNQNIPLEPDSVIVCFSDGVSEAENKQRELFGTERIAQSLAKITFQDSTEIKLSLMKDVKDFVGQHEQNDDITLVVVRI
jgi:sigma-B regulation protein RsbU (phosphoserine phosphatase)